MMHVFENVIDSFDPCVQTTTAATSASLLLSLLFESRQKMIDGMTQTLNRSLNVGWTWWTRKQWRWHWIGVV